MKLKTEKVKMKLSLTATPALVSAWVQPAWKDVQAALNHADQRDPGNELDWGHPIEGDAKKWYHCPALTKPGNKKIRNFSWESHKNIILKKYFSGL